MGNLTEKQIAEYKKLAERVEDMANDTEVDMHSVASLNAYFHKCANAIKVLLEEREEQEKDKSSRIIINDFADRMFADQPVSTQLTFSSPQAMLDLITVNCTDLYNRETGDYVFVWNEKNAIRVYHMEEEEAMKLAEKGGNLWSAYLDRRDGTVYDSPANLEYCTSMYNKSGWVTAADYEMETAMMILNKEKQEQDKDYLAGLEPMYHQTESDASKIGKRIHLLNNELDAYQKTMNSLSVGTALKEEMELFTECADRMRKILSVTERQLQFEISKQALQNCQENMEELDEELELD